MHDAVDWKIIDENPFCKVKTQKSSVKVNEFVPREVVDKLMKKANPVWRVILGLSRYGGLRTLSLIAPRSCNLVCRASKRRIAGAIRDIDWEMNRMSIPEPKVEHHEGRGIRSCTTFPELRPILDEAFEIFGDVWRQKRIRGLTCTPRSQERYQHAGKRYRADFGFFYPRFFRA